MNRPPQRPRPQPDGAPEKGSGRGGRPEASASEGGKSVWPQRPASKERSSEARADSSPPPPRRSPAVREVREVREDRPLRRSRSAPEGTPPQQGEAARSAPQGQAARSAQKRAQEPGGKRRAAQTRNGQGQHFRQQQPPRPAPRPPISPRLLAAELIAGMWQGRSLSDQLPRELERTAPIDRALAAELAQGVARWGHRLEAICQRLLNHPLEERHLVVRALLLVGIYQLAYLRIPPHAAVSETVNAAGRVKPWARGLVNGVLRNYQRRAGEELAHIEQLPALHYSHPEWLVNRLQAAWPAQWEAILEAANQRPPMHLRVNRSRIDRKLYAAQLSSAGIAARPLPHCPDGLVLDTPIDVSQLPGFAEGLVSVQDGAAQLAALLLDPTPGGTLLDACAAPGGKSCHLLEITPERSLTALDKEQRRMQRLHDNLARLGLHAEVVVGDAANPQGPWAERRYRQILLDLPCSATGVIRRHPDIKWLRREEDIAAMALRQRAILEAVWPLLEPGGTLLYVTCSLLPEENHEVVEAFLQHHPEAQVDPIDAAWGVACGPGRQLLPGNHGFDGLFYARLRSQDDAE